MDWLYPSSSYDPISNGQSPRGLSAWALSNSALANLNKTTNQLIAEGQQQNSLAGSSAPGLAAIPAGSNDPNGYGGYGQTTDVLGVLGNIASFAASPLAFGARAIASMIANHPTVYGITDAFSGKPTSISGRIADQFRGDIVNPDVVSPDKTASLADYGKADYGLGSDYSGTIGGPDGKNASDVGTLSESQNAENNAAEGGKEGGKDGGSKFAAGGLVGYAEGGLVDYDINSRSSDNNLPIPPVPPDGLSGFGSINDREGRDITRGSTSSTMGLSAGAAAIRNWQFQNEVERMFAAGEISSKNYAEMMSDILRTDDEKSSYYANLERRFNTTTGRRAREDGPGLGPAARERALSIYKRMNALEQNGWDRDTLIRKENSINRDEFNRLYKRIPYGIAEGYAGGGLVNGATGGMADVVPAGNYDTISDGEYVLPADFVAMLGDGNTRAGGRALDKAVARLRKLKYGRGKQPPAFRGTLEDLL